MRLFIAIPLAAAVASELSAVTRRLQRGDDGLRWASAASWHVTLQFLGNTGPQQYACLATQLRSITSSPVPLQIEGLGFFDRVGVFFAGVRLSRELVALQRRVTAVTQSCGFEPETRPYHPHITLARSKGRGNGLGALKASLEASLSRATEFPAFVAREFLLYESLLGPGGSRYEVRERFPLAEAG